jgi:hypothetical protein
VYVAIGVVGWRMFVRFVPAGIQSTSVIHGAAVFQGAMLRHVDIDIMKV